MWMRIDERAKYEEDTMAEQPSPEVMGLDLEPWELALMGVDSQEEAIFRIYGYLPGQVHLDDIRNANNLPPNSGKIIRELA